MSSLAIPFSSASLPIPSGTHWASQVPDAPLYTCHGLITPPTLHILTIPDASLGLRVRYSSGQSKQTFFGAMPALQDHGNPCGLCIALSTLHLSCSRLKPLRHRRKTRYWWLVRPYQTGTFTLQGAPSCAWRTNALLTGKQKHSEAALLIFRLSNLLNR
jgi:hypothetical protein